MRIRSIRTSLGALALLLAAAFASAESQASTSGTPEEFAKRYIATINAGNFAATAALMHPVALTSVRHFLLALASRDPSGMTLQKFAGVQDTAALRALPDSEMYARFIKASFETQPELSSALRTATGQILGHVDEAPDLTHVVYRMTMQLSGTPLHKIDVLSLRRWNGQWRALLSDDLESVTARITSGGT